MRQRGYRDIRDTSWELPTDFLAAVELRIAALRDLFRE